MPREMTVDTKSYDLAEHFLQDVKASEREKMSLARSIQTAVEDWFAFADEKDPDHGNG